MQAADPELAPLSTAPVIVVGTGGRGVVLRKLNVDEARISAWRSRTEARDAGPAKRTFELTPHDRSSSNR